MLLYFNIYVYLLPILEPSPFFPSLSCVSSMRYPSTDLPCLIQCHPPFCPFSSHLTSLLFHSISLLHNLRASLAHIHLIALSVYPQLSSDSAISRSTARELFPHILQLFLIALLHAL
jgi:hypothetical protein